MPRDPPVMIVTCSTRPTLAEVPPVAATTDRSRSTSIASPAGAALVEVAVLGWGRRGNWAWKRRHARMAAWWRSGFPGPVVAGAGVSTDVSAPVHPLGRPQRL